MNDRIKNPVKFKERSAAYYLRNIQYINHTVKLYRKNNPEATKERSMNYHAKNSDKMKAYHSAYRIKNKEALRLKAIENNKKRRNKRNLYYSLKKQNDPLFKLKTLIRDRIRKALKNRYLKKNNLTTEILGCEVSFAVTYLESKFKKGMTWLNFGEWEIDHIIPLASAKTTQELYVLFHYSNLQPLWKQENRDKSDKILPTQMVMTI